MVNDYRVDLNNVLRVPCGMTSIKYLGSNRAEAERAFVECQATEDYGVILSKWDSAKNDYVILSSKWSY